MYLSLWLLLSNVTKQSCPFYLGRVFAWRTPCKQILKDQESEHSVIVPIRLKENGSYLGVIWHRKQLEVCLICGHLHKDFMRTKKPLLSSSKFICSRTWTQGPIYWKGYIAEVSDFLRSDFKSPACLSPQTYILLSVNVMWF